ncbi:hypothetical protein D9758_010391 [Tetrapyrgos nigripes]|uniref:Xylanolytic transcriptional activator regulatory domain-containing protein n=1 Tax=Tetrapyrgos nigripes TaxID=182062 RepID=A0A8H5FVY7_9AGAR|nr:hypothetical protein D9758_010391 [Tetrapyrgos nigripes]
MGVSMTIAETRSQAWVGSLLPVFFSDITHHSSSSRSSRPGFSQIVKELVSQNLKGTASEVALMLEDNATTKEVITQLISRIKVLEDELAICRREHRPLIRDKEKPDSADGRKKTLSDDADDVEQLSREMSRFTLAPATTSPRRVYLGESSDMMLVVTAMNHRKQVDYGLPGWESLLKKSKRAKFWDFQPWSPAFPDASTFDFPDIDQLRKLVDAYFIHQNTYMPLLHRPSFERSINEGLHLRDDAFGALVLSVCALGAIFLEEHQLAQESEDTPFISPGMKWFQQLPIAQTAFGQRSISLYHIQMYTLAVVYVQNLSGGSDIAYMMAGIAVRLAQQKGAHRSVALALGRGPTTENELWKRVFWVLFSLDSKLSAMLGCPRGITIEDSDLVLEHCVECDDEYWESTNPTEIFVQPPGRPARIAYWKHFMKLMEIVFVAHQAVYSVRTNGLRQQNALKQINSDFSKWVESIPSHLKWNPNHQDSMFFSQSAALYGVFYWIQIQVYRKFIPKPRQDSEMPFSTLEICTNAARSCIGVVQVALKKSVVRHYLFLYPLYGSAMILAVNMWREKYMNPGYDPKSELDGMNACIDMLRTFETRYSLAGRLVDTINAVMSANYHERQTSGWQATSRLDPTLSNENQTTSTDSTSSYSNEQLYTYGLFHHSGSQIGSIASNWGYHHDITAEELAIFDQNTDVNNNSSSAVAAASQPEDWDILMSSMDHIFSSMERS